MKAILMLSVFLGLVFVQAQVIAQNTKQVNIQYFNTVQNTQIRALEVLNDSTVWFAGYKGIWGYTENGGKTWHIDSIINSRSELNFRSMAVLNDSTILLMSIASPAYIYKTNDKGKNWKIVYENVDTNAFMDCLKFINYKKGYALGDPINNCVQLLETTDAGETWKNIDCKLLPTLNDGEAFFATSNTNMEIFPSNIYIASGGKTSRLWHIQLEKGTFISKNTPLPSGEQMTGIFSMDFFNKNTGLIGGGHYDKKDKVYNCIAYTKDSGNTWQTLSFTKPMFSSCVQFINQKNFISTGHSGSLYYQLSKKKYLYLKDQFNQELYFHCVKVSPNKKHIWFAGRDGRIASLKISELK